MKKNILVVESHLSTSILLEEVLSSREDFCVFVGKDLKTSLHLVKSVYFDLIITNTKIEGVKNFLSLFNFLNDIRKITGGVPVLIYSADYVEVLGEIRSLFNDHIQYPDLISLDPNKAFLEKVEKLLS